MSRARLAVTTIAVAGAVTAASGPASAAQRRAGSGAVVSAGARATSSALRSATGEDVDYHYGVIAVRAFVSGKKIVKITVPVLQVDAQLSEQLARYSLPVLEREVLRAQRAKVAAVSGATWTSAGFEMSLQSALSKLHVT